jgi:hypothetical protein
MKIDKTVGHPVGVHARRQESSQRFKTEYRLYLARAWKKAFTMLSRLKRHAELPMTKRGLISVQRPRCKTEVANVLSTQERSR